jgi:hypothetical protein
MIPFYFKLVKVNSKPFSICWLLVDMSDVEVNDFGTGEPVSQDFIAEGIKARESKLNSEAKHFQESLIKSNSEGNELMSSFLDMLKKGGIDVDKTIRAVEQRKKELIKRVENP